MTSSRQHRSRAEYLLSRTGDMETGVGLDLALRAVEAHVNLAIIALEHEKQDSKRHDELMGPV